MAGARFLAFDLGAESGRAIIGTLDDGRLGLSEIHRFANEPVEVCGVLHWNVLSLFGSMLAGMRIASRFADGVLDGIGIDTWGVDFGLLDASGSLIGNPVHYRDRRTEGILEEVRRRMPAEKLYRVTGMSLSPIQTLCQLLAMRLKRSPALASAATFLMMPDLFGYFLTGEKRVERTNAINTQFYDPVSGTWWREVLEVFDLPGGILPPLADPATTLGPLLPSVARQAGLSSVPVIAPCTHDTGSAVAAVPAAGDDWAFLSCGTWSVVGALSPPSVEGGFAGGLCNEVTLGGRFLCSNIMGLWLLQQARKRWESEGASYSHDELVQLARRSDEGRSFVNPDDPVFLAPDDMIAAIRGYCARTGQPAPKDPGEVTRVILESLALSYRRTLETIARLLGRKFRVLHIVGGGSLNALLCQFTADATGLPVLAGPVEATVAGNVLAQALARRHVSSAVEIREVVRRSMAILEYEPRESGRWEERYARFRGIVERRVG
jgi:rhamnulokinase